MEAAAEAEQVSLVEYQIYQPHESFWYSSNWNALSLPINFASNQLRRHVILI